MLRTLLSFLFFMVSLPSASAPRESVEIEGNKIVGVEIFIADKGAQIESSFGHALLRLVDNDGLWANDTVISFVADVNGNINPVKGIAGGYDVTAEVRTLHEYWNYYTNLSGRGFKRYPISMEQNQLDNFLTVLKDYIQDPAPLGDYKFISNNCVSILTKIFDKAGLVYRSGDLQYVPKSISGWVDMNMVSPFLPMETNTHKNIKEFIQSGERLSFEEYKERFTPTELAYIYLNDRQLDFQTMLKIAQTLKADGVNIDDVFGLAPLPAKLYSKEFDGEFLMLEEQAFSRTGAIKNALRRFEIENDRSFSKSALAAEMIPSQLDKRLLSEVELGFGERLREFDVKKNRRELRASIVVKEGNAVTATAHEYGISGIEGDLERIDRRTYLINGNQYLKLVRKRDSLKLYLLK